MGAPTPGETSVVSGVGASPALGASGASGEPLVTGTSLVCDRDGCGASDGGLADVIMNESLLSHEPASGRTLHIH